MDPYLSESSNDDVALLMMITIAPLPLDDLWERELTHFSILMLEIFFV